MNKIIIILLLIMFIFSACQNNNNFDKSLCEKYSNQKVTSSRIPIDGGEKELSINGTWVKERILIKNCPNITN